MTSNPKDAVSPLFLIEACARQLREDVEKGKLWPGEFAERRAAIADAVLRLPEGNRR